jgi:hypothetical protein
MCMPLQLALPASRTGHSAAPLLALQWGEDSLTVRPRRLPMTSATILHIGMGYTCRAFLPAHRWFLASSAVMLTLFCRELMVLLLPLTSLSAGSAHPHAGGQGGPPKALQGRSRSLSSLREVTRQCKLNLRDTIAQELPPPTQYEQ